MAGSVLIPSVLHSETVLLTTMMEASTTHSWVRVFTSVVLPAWNNFPWIVLWIPPHHHSECVLSCFSHVQLCETPWTVACQAPPSIGFPRQEYWSGLPFPSPGIFPTQGSNLGLLLDRWVLYHWTTREAPLCDGLLPFLWSVNQDSSYVVCPSCPAVSEQSVIHRKSDYH